jgi:hypothetical protein
MNLPSNFAFEAGEAAERFLSCLCAARLNAAL